MWEIIKENKISVSLVAVIVIGLIVYSFFMFTGTEDGTELVEGEDDGLGQQQIGSEIFQEVRRLERISFDGSVFDDPVYKSLNHFGYLPAPREEGRNNPFAPIGDSTGRDLITDESLEINEEEDGNQDEEELEETEETEESEEE